MPNTKRTFEAPPDLLERFLAVSRENLPEDFKEISPEGRALLEQHGHALLCAALAMYESMLKLACISIIPTAREAQPWPSDPDSTFFN